MMQTPTDQSGSWKLTHIHAWCFSPFTVHNTLAVAHILPSWGSLQNVWVQINLSSQHQRKREQIKSTLAFLLTLNQPAWLPTSAFRAATLNKSKQKWSALMYRMYCLKFSFFHVPLWGSRKCEWQVTHTRPPLQQRKDCGPRVRQDWRHRLGSLLHEVRQLSEDWTGWLTHS